MSSRRRTALEGPRARGWAGQTTDGAWIAPKGTAPDVWYWGSRAALESAALEHEMNGGGVVTIYRATAQRACDAPGQRAILARCAVTAPALEPVTNGKRARIELAAKLARRRAVAREEKAAAKRERDLARAAREAKRSAPRPAPVNAPRKAPRPGRAPAARPAADLAPSARGFATVAPPRGWTAPLGSTAATELPSVAEKAARMIVRAHRAGDTYAAGAVVYELQRGAVVMYHYADGVHWAADRRLVALDVEGDPVAAVDREIAVGWRMWEQAAHKARAVGILAIERTEHLQHVRGVLTPHGQDVLVWITDGRSACAVNALALRALIDATVQPVIVCMEKTRVMVLSGGHLAFALQGIDSKAPPKRPRRK